MKAILCSLLIALSATSQAKTIDLKNKRLPKINLTYQNTAMLEQTIRQNGGRKLDMSKIEIELECTKSAPVRGRSDTKAYSCKPIEVSTP